MNSFVKKWLDDNKFIDNSTSGNESYISVVNYNHRDIEDEPASDGDIVLLTKSYFTDEYGNLDKDFVCELHILRQTAGVSNGAMSFLKRYPLNTEPTMVELSTLIEALGVHLHEKS